MSSSAEVWKNLAFSVVMFMLHVTVTLRHQRTPMEISMATNDSVVANEISSIVNLIMRLVGQPARRQWSVNAGRTPR